MSSVTENMSFYMLIQPVLLAWIGLSLFLRWQFSVSSGQLIELFVGEIQ